MKYPVVSYKTYLRSLNADNFYNYLRFNDEGDGTLCELCKGDFVVISRFARGKYKFSTATVKRIKGKDWVIVDNMGLIIRIPSSDVLFIIDKWI